MVAGTSSGAGKTTVTVALCRALAYSVRHRGSQEPLREGYRIGDNVLASYVHAHWASNPRVAGAFVASCRRAAVEPMPPVAL